jgi:hypothetical protein
MKNSGAFLALFLLTLRGPNHAFAFDPFTVTAVVGGVSSALGTVSDLTSEVSSSATAFQELYSEIDSEAQISEDGQRILDRVQEIESLAREIGYTSEELDELGHTDPEDVKKLSTTLRSITQAVRVGKRASRLVLKLDQKAKVAEIESAQLEREQLVAMYRLIRLQQEANLQAIEDRLREAKEKKNEIQSLREELSKKGVKTFGKTGILSFPRQSISIESAIDAGNKMKPYLMGLMLLVFLARVVYQQFSFGGINSYGDLIRDTLICGFLMMIYPELVRGSLVLSDGLA